MGLLTETNEQYYAGQQAQVATGVASPNEVLATWGTAYLPLVADSSE